jgi:hypothetical protein
MSTTLSYNYKKPDSGDKGFWTDLEDNFTQLATHDHNGTNSAKLSLTSINTPVSTITATTGWTSVNSTSWKASITMPNPFQFDSVEPQLRDSTTGEVLYLKIVKTGANTFDVYTNTVSLGVRIIYR